MRIKSFLITLIAFLSSFSLKAQDFFSTEDAPQFFSLGARVGFNTSNRTFLNSAFTQWNNNSWGTGFDIGVMANLNFKDYLSVQPGIFFESRSGDYAYATDYITNFNKADQFYQLGHMRSYYLTVPIMAIVKFNLAERIRWSVEAGPYLQFCLRDSGEKNIDYLFRLATSNAYELYSAKSNKFDAGLKIGTGLTFYEHYYVGVHYLAGFCNAWTEPAGGKNKAWTFTVGYDF